MATFNPVTPDSLYGQLQPETFSAGMRGEHFGPDVAALMLPEGASQTEVNRAVAGYQQDILPQQQALEQARARQDKQTMELMKFRMAQDSHRMALRSADLSARKAQFEYQKTITDANQEASIMQRMPIVIDQLDVIRRDPTLDHYQKSSEAARLQGYYATQIAKSPALKGLFDSWQVSNAAERAGEAQEFQRGFQLGQQGYAPDTTMPEFAAGQQAKKRATIAKEGRDDQIKKLNAEWEYLDGLEKRLDDLDTMYAAADPVTDRPEGLTLSDDGTLKVDRTMPKVYTPQAQKEAVLIARRIGTHSGMTQQQIEELVKGATDMPSFIPLLKSGLWDLRNRNYEQKGALFNYGPTGGAASPTAPSIGSWGAPST